LTEIATSSHIDVGENLEDENEERGSVSNEKQLD